MANNPYLLTDTKFDDFFKNVYGKRADATYNMTYAYLSRIRKVDDFVGKTHIDAKQISRSGSVASGSLPNVNLATVVNAIYSRKKTYGRYIVDRETLVAGVGNHASFEESQKFIIKATIDSYTRNNMRILFGDGTLGTIDASGVTDNGGGEYDIVISAATFKEANWEEGDYINIESGNTDEFEVIAVAPSTRTITVQRNSGSQVPADTDVIYMQKSEGNEPTGFQSAFTEATSLYGIPIQRRWSPYSRNAGAAVSESFLSDALLDMSKATGEAPTAIYMSYDQGKKYLAGLDKPVYQDSRMTVNVKSGGYTASYSALSILSPASPRPIPIFIDRFVPDKEIWLINESRVYMKRAPKHGWFTEDGLFARVDGEDQYEARYGGYWEQVIDLPYHGRIYNLD